MHKQWKVKSEYYKALQTRANSKFLGRILNKLPILLNHFENFDHSQKSEDFIDSGNFCDS